MGTLRAPVLRLHTLSLAVGRDVDGILGFSAFDDVLLTLDYPAEEIRVSGGRLPRPDGREIFASTPMIEMLERLDREDCIAAAMQKPLEVAQDRQVLANGYLPQHPRDSRARLSASPVQFDEGQVEFKCGAPELGQDTELILQELGYDWDAMTKLKKQQVVN